MSEPDLSKIVSLIMENQGLIEEIRGLASKSEEPSGAAENAAPEEPDGAPVEVALEDSGESGEADAGVSIEKSIKKNKRRELLCALKPYVSKQRSQAIDTMISIAEILDMMKTR